MSIDLTKLSEQELKAFWLDKLIAIEGEQQVIQLIRAELQRRFTPQPIPKVVGD